MDFKSHKADILAGIVVFFVALPLCLGIAVASGTPPITGLLSGIVGGLLVGVLSKSQVSVSGPAAGLVAIVIGGIASIGSFQGFLLAVVIGGAIQLILGFLKAGTIAYFFPSSVIKGMLTAIGIIIILKQLPHFVGYDSDYEGDLAFFQLNHEDSLTTFYKALSLFDLGVTIVGIASILAIILWDKFKPAALKVVPGALFGVLVGLLSNWILGIVNPTLQIQSSHLVNLPLISGWNDVKSLITFPDFSMIGQMSVWVVGISIALVASIESLLTIEATDKIDPLRRVTPTNRELIAQGAGNLVGGLIGALPITSVIVRSSANINSGAKTKLATIFHGFLLLLGTLFLGAYLNKIPLTSLAAILLLTGWKLANPKIFSSMLKLDYTQWLPFVVTVVAVVFSDLLKGIGIGMIVSLILLLVKNMQNGHFVSRKSIDDRTFINISLPEEVNFLKKASMLLTLDRISAGSKVNIDASKCNYIDYDVLEIIREFANEKAKDKGIEVKLSGFKDAYYIKTDQTINMETT